MRKEMESFGSMPIGEGEAAEAEHEPPKPMGNADYVVAVINMTNVLLTRQRVRVGAGNWTPWFTMAGIGRTCNYADAQKCFEAHSYVPVTTIGCGGPSFSLELRSNDGQGAVWDNLYADCQRAGGVVVLTP